MKFANYLFGNETRQKPANLASLDAWNSIVKSTRPPLIGPRPLIQSVEMDSEKSWKHSAAQPWWHAGRCPGQRWTLWILPTDQRSQAGLCPGPNAAQWRFQPCYLTPLESVSLALASGTVPTESYSTPGGCKLSPRWGRLFSGTFCLLMTAPETNKRCKQGQIFLSLQ